MSRVIVMIFFVSMEAVALEKGFVSYFNNQFVQYSPSQNYVSLKFFTHHHYKTFLNSYQSDARILWDRDKPHYIKRIQTAFLKVNGSANRRRVVREVEGQGFAQSVPVYEIDGKYTLPATPFFMVQFRESVQPSDIKRYNQLMNVSIVRKLRYLQNGYLLRLNQRQDCTEILSRYGSHPAVNYIHPQFWVRFRRYFKPNDPYYPLLWHLNGNKQQFQYVSDWGIYKAEVVKGAGIDAEKAWNISTGSETVIIAIIDTGCDLGHEDLKGKYTEGYDLVNDGAQVAPGSCTADSHGTSCAAIAAAFGDNQVGTTGLCMKCRLMPIRLFDAEAEDYNIESNAAEAFQIAADNGASVISNSWGLTDLSGADMGSPVIEQGMTYAKLNGRAGKGTVIFFASGNGNPRTGAGVENNDDSLCFSEAAICIGASNAHNQRASYSNFGPGLDLLAPSSDFDRTHSDSWFMAQIISADISGNLGANRAGTNVLYEESGLELSEIDSKGDYTYYFGGTSAACPLAAGLAGLVLSVNPELTSDEVREILIASADLIDKGAAKYNSEGFSEKYGYGKINAYKALKMAKNLKEKIGEKSDGSISMPENLAGDSPKGLGCHQQLEVDKPGDWLIIVFLVGCIVLVHWISVRHMQS